MYKIEPVQTNDYTELIALWESSVRATHDFLSEAYINELRPLILDQYFDMVDLYCVRDNGLIIGFLGTSGEGIEMLFIDPKSRGKGVGKSLLEFAIDKLECNKVDVNEQNQQAIDFYLHMGFEITGRSDLDGQGKPYPILHLQL